ncbi:MAG: APC family permease [Clostridia bacterium]|nr:APC family permease [Clostridia bacterium]
MEENGLKKKYGLFTAIAMVIGIVIGSGVFFKAQNILNATGGDMWTGILAWIIGGIAMVICACAFALIATKYEKTNGAIDYAESTCGKGYAYYMGWFMATIYYPAMTSVLAWVSARYFCELIGWDIAGAECMTIAGTLLVGSFVLNSLAPKISGKFQISTTVIKLIPLIIMMVVGTIYGLATGITVENFTAAANTATGDSGLFKAIVATAFAYEGWICATSINSEIKDSKKNLPKALLWGSIVIISIYILYFIGVAGAASTTDLINGGATVAFNNIFGNVGGTILTVFVMVSCLGTLNGLTMGSTRAMYGIATRDCGPRPNTFKNIDSQTDMPANSCFIGLLTCSLWLLYFFGANLTTPWFGLFSFDSSELPIITIYAFYIPIFINWMRKQKEETKFRRFVLPIMAIIACVFMVFCAIMGHGVFPCQAAAENGEFSFPVLFYLIVFAAIMCLGWLLNRKNKKLQPQESLQAKEENAEEPAPENTKTEETEKQETEEENKKEPTSTKQKKTTTNKKKTNKK